MLCLSRFFTVAFLNNALMTENLGPELDTLTVFLLLKEADGNEQAAMHGLVRSDAPAVTTCCSPVQVPRCPCFSYSVHRYRH